MAARRRGKRSSRAARDEPVKAAQPLDVPQPTLALGAVLGAVALAFLPVLSAQFVAIDDDGHIAANVHFQSGSPWSFLAFWSKPYFGLYVPVAYTVWSFAATISHALTGGLSPAVFHALSLATHLLNVVLVYRLLRRLVGDATAATLGAAAITSRASCRTSRPAAWSPRPSAKNSR